MLFAQVATAQMTGLAAQEPVRGGAACVIYKQQGFHTDSQAVIVEAKSYTGTPLAKTVVTAKGQQLELYPRNDSIILPYPNTLNCGMSESSLGMIAIALKRFPQHQTKLKALQSLWVAEAENERVANEKSELLRRQAEQKAIEQEKAWQEKKRLRDEEEKKRIAEQEKAWQEKKRLRDEEEKKRIAEQEKQTSEQNRKLADIVEQIKKCSSEMKAALSALPYKKADRSKTSQMRILKGQMFITKKDASAVKLSGIYLLAIDASTVKDNIASFNGVYEKYSNAIRTVTQSFNIGDFYLIKNASERIDDATKQAISSSIGFFYCYQAALTGCIASAQTDADGNFIIEIPENVPVILTSEAQRAVSGRENEEYFWFRKLDARQMNETIILTNDSVKDKHISSLLEY